MISGFVALAVLVRKSAFRVPGKEPRIVVRDLLASRVSKLCSLFVVPHRRIGIVGISDGLVRLVHPLRNGAEIDDDRVTLRSLQKVYRHRINQRKIPRGLSIFRRLQLRDAEARVGEPGNVANVIGAEFVKRLERVVVHGSSPAKRRVYDDLQRWRRFRFHRHMIPMNSYFRRRILCTGRERSGERQHWNKKPASGIQ